jgi:paraquat-inducible protein B
MSKHANPATIGAFVVGAVAIALLAIIVLGSGALFRRSSPFVLYFDGSVNGLRTGAQVKFKGVEIGKVKHIRIPISSTAPDLPISVLIELDSDRLSPSGGAGILSERLDLSEEIAKGLRAQLESESFVTGILFVSLKYAPETEAKLHGSLDDAPEIPTVPAQLEAMQSEVSLILSELRRIDFKNLVDQTTRAITTFADLAAAPETHSALASLDQTLVAIRSASLKFEEQLGPLVQSVGALAEETRGLQSELAQGVTSARRTLDSVDSLVVTIDRHAEPLLASIQASSDHLQALAATLEATLRTTRTLIDPESPLAVELRAAMAEVTRTAKSTRALMEYLERNPSALVRGKPEKD